MKAIFPSTIDGDLLKLVHLSNGFRLVKGAVPLKAGDVCKAEARVVSVANTDAGKSVKVKGFVSRGGQPVIEVTSSFLYRGTFTDFQNTFELTEEPDYTVDLPDDAAVGVHAVELASRDRNAGRRSVRQVRSGGSTGLGAHGVRGGQGRCCRDGKGGGRQRNRRKARCRPPSLAPAHLRPRAARRIEP